MITRTLIQRVRNPDASDVLRLYLELPEVIQLDGPCKVRSSFEAAFTDAQNASNGGTSWIGAIGHLCFLDQLGGVIERTDLEPDRGGDVERALQLFSDLDEPERAALYALRCALAHDYSLANLADRVTPRHRHLYRHHFALWPAFELPVLVKFPDEPWDGEAMGTSDTHVDLGRLQDLVVSVRERVLDLHRQQRLALAASAADIRRWYFFMHPVGDDEQQS